MRVQKIDIFPEFHPNRPIFQTDYSQKTANGGTLVRSMPHKMPLKKGISSLRSEVKNLGGVLVPNFWILFYSIRDNTYPPFPSNH